MLKVDNKVQKKFKFLIEKKQQQQHVRLFFTFTRGDLNLLIKCDWDSFLQGDQAGTFVRGSDVNLRSGQYFIRYTGVYHLTATLLISRDRDTNLRPRDYIKISICINSLCELNT